MRKIFLTLFILLSMTIIQKGWTQEKFTIQDKLQKLLEEMLENNELEALEEELAEGDLDDSSDNETDCSNSVNERVCNLREQLADLFAEIRTEKCCAAVDDYLYNSASVCNSKSENYDQEACLLAQLNVADTCGWDRRVVTSTTTDFFGKTKFENYTSTWSVICLIDAAEDSMEDLLSTLEELFDVMLQTAESVATNIHNV